MRSFWLFLMFLAFLAGCSQQNESEPPQATVTILSAEEAPRVAALGDSVAKDLLKTLKHELVTTIQQAGVVEAIKVCNVKALPLTQQVAQQFGTKVDVKRTSFKIRNPKNQPDDYERKALEFFQQALENGQPLPSHLIQKIEQKDHTVYRYYMPLKVAALCVNCHGDPGHMPEELKQKLAQLYPQDQATGYKAGDFRGVIRVEFKDETIVNRIF